MDIRGLKNQSTVLYFPITKPRDIPAKMASESPAKALSVVKVAEMRASPDCTNENQKMTIFEEGGKTYWLTQGSLAAKSQITKTTNTE